MTRTSNKPMNPPSLARPCVAMLLCGAALGVWGCGDSDSEGPTGESDEIVYGAPIAEPVTFESADGRVRLVASEGTRLPEGGVTIEIISAGELDSALQSAFDEFATDFQTPLAMRFAPAGAEFNLPLRLHALVDAPSSPEDPHLYGVAMLEDGEAVARPRLRILGADADTLEIQADIAHFSEAAIRQALQTKLDIEQLDPDDDLYVKDADFRPRVAFTNGTPFELDVLLDFNATPCVVGVETDIPDTGSYEDEVGGELVYRGFKGVQGSVDFAGPVFRCTEHSPDEICGRARLSGAIVLFKPTEVQVRAAELGLTTPVRAINEVVQDDLRLLKGGVRCIGDGAFTDPRDLTGLPSVDVIGTVASQIPNAVGHWFRIQMDGDFPPPDGIYSWFVRIEYMDADGNVVARMVYQTHDGLQETLPTWFTDADIEIQLGGGGLLARLRAEHPDAETALITTGFAKEPGDTVQQDMVGPIPLNALSHLP